MGTIFGRCASKQVGTELVKRLGDSYGVHMARKESTDEWPKRVLYYMFVYDKPFQKQLGVMAFLEAHG